MGVRKRINVADLHAHIGEGEESKVYPDPKNFPGLLLKLYFHPDDEEFRGNANAALEKLKEIQTKLREFPKTLPERVIVPVKLARDPDAPRGMKIAGYFMHFLQGAEELARYKEPKFLDKLGTDHVDILNYIVIAVFRDLHKTVSELHKHTPQVIIGDLSDTNVLVKGSCAYLCDADSFGFGKYPARMGKSDLRGPLLSKKGPSPDTDWYAYTVLLVQSLLGVGPYGGIYILPKMIMPMPLDERIRRRISIFERDVKPPKYATKWTIAPTMLPDNLIEHFKAVFGYKNKRGIFPAHLLDMRWTRCMKCAAVHAKARCPACGVQVVEAPQETIDTKDLLIRIIDPLGLSDAGKVEKFGFKEAAYRIADPLGLFTRRPGKRS